MAENLSDQMYLEEEDQENNKEELKVEISVNNENPNSEEIEREESVPSQNLYNDEHYERINKLQEMEYQSRNSIIDKEHSASYDHTGVYAALMELKAAVDEMSCVTREEKTETDDDVEINMDLKSIEEKACQMDIDYRNLNEDKYAFNSFSNGVLDHNGVPEKPYKSANKMSKHEIANELKKRQINLEYLLSCVDSRQGRDDKMKAVRKLIYNIEESESHLTNATDPFTDEIKDILYKIKRETITSLPIATFEAEYSAEYFIATAARAPNWRKDHLGRGRGFALLEENRNLGFKSILDRFDAIKLRLEASAQMAKKIMSDKLHYPPGSDEQSQHVISVINAAHVSEMKNLKETYANMFKKHQDISFLLRRATVKQHRAIRETKRDSTLSTASIEAKYLEQVTNLHSIDKEISEMEAIVVMNKKELKSLLDVARAAEAELHDTSFMDEADELKAKRKILERERERLLDLKRDVFETLHRVKAIKNSDDPISPYNR